MYCLVISDTFPNKVAPWRGPYNRYQIEGLAEFCKVTVINPISWTELLRNPEYGRLLHGLDGVLRNVPVYHPLLLHLPIWNRGSNWKAVRRALDKSLKRIDADEIDVILATFAYPHGLAAKELARRLGVPYVIKARGSDLHSLPEDGGRLRGTREALSNACAVVTVSHNLARLAKDMGSKASRVHILPNGVDTDAFRPLARTEARKSLGLEIERSICLFVGNLRPVKGLDVLVKALSHMSHDGALAVVAGEGSMRGWLKRQARRADLAGRLQLVGQLSRDKVLMWMNAADVVVLPSRNEGCPNVVLEALACGTPVVASRVGEVPHLLDPECGIQVQPEDARGLAEALEEAIDRDWDRQMIRGKVQHLTWQNNVRRLHSILDGAVREQTGSSAGREKTPSPR